MGCCLGRPVIEVKQDPSVSSYTEVGDIIIAVGLSHTIVRGSSGLMYIQGDSLYYELISGSSLCCCKCCMRRFQLSQIDTVEIVDSQQMMTIGSGHAICLAPGLKISAHPNTTVLVAMPDAVSFALQLTEASNSHKEKLGIDDGF